MNMQCPATLRPAARWLALVGALALAGCATVSLESPGWPPLKDQPRGSGSASGGAPVETRTPLPTTARPTLPEDAGVVVTPVASSPLDAAAAATAARVAPVGNWSGTYHGLLPCADCEGIRALLTLNRDSSYVLSLSYVGRDALPMMMRGNFTWNADETLIQLDAHGDYRRYQIGQGEARMLNRDGSPISGVLAQSYVLKKRVN